MNKKEPTILYLCDQRACEECDSESRDCKWTSNIEHAKNFKKKYDVYEEQETSSEKKQILVIKIDAVVSSDTVIQIKETLNKRMESGMLILPKGWDAYNVTDEGEIKIETEENKNELYYQR
jgi:hypothetical protein